MQKKERKKKALYKLSAYSRSARVEQERRPGECFLKGVGWGGSGRVGGVNLGSYFEQKEGGMEGRKRRVAAGHQGASV